MDGRCQTVSARVANPDRVVLGLEFGDRAHRSKDLLLHDLHVIGNVGEDGWLDEEALVAMAFTTNLDLGTGFLAFVDVSRKVEYEGRV